jgi:hypothetical protein
MIKIMLSCRLSTDVPVFSVCGHLFSVWSIATYLRRFVHGWRLHQEILLPYMGDSIIYGLALHLYFRQSTIAQHWYVFRIFYVFFRPKYYRTAMCIFAMQRPGVIAWWVIKAPIFEKNVYSWRLQWRILFPYMGGSIIYGLDLHPLRYIIRLAFFIFLVWYFWTAVCIVAMQRLGVMLEPFK